MTLVLVEWVHFGEPRHQACESKEHLAACLYILGGLRGVTRVTVWDETFINDLTDMGMCGHA